MAELKMGVVESHFADIIWENEPLSSSRLCTICAEELGWKRTTTYTVLKKLCDRGIFKNDGGEVSSLIKKDEYFAAKSEEFVEKTFNGSLPAMFAAFTSKKKLSEKEINEIMKMMEKAKEEAND